MPSFFATSSPINRPPLPNSLLIVIILSAILQSSLFCEAKSQCASLMHYALLWGEDLASLFCEAKSQCASLMHYAPLWGEDSASFFCIKKVCTYLISWTYADKLHTFKCIIYFHNVRQQAHKKTSSKTGFTLVCYSFRSYYISLLGKSQTKIFLLFLVFCTHQL